MKKKKKRIGLQITGGLLIGCVAGYAVFAFKAHQSVEHELTLAREQGLWTNFKEVESRPMPAKDENAATFYQPLCKTFEAAPGRKPKALDPKTHEESEADFQTRYVSVGPFLDQFEKAAQLPKCQFERDWQLGPALLLPEYSQLKNIFSIVSTEARYLSRKGRAKEALELMNRFAPMAWHAGTDPLFLSGLIQIAIDNVAFRTLQIILGTHGLEPGIAELAKSVVERLGPPPDASMELSGECAMLMRSFDSPNMLSEIFSYDNKGLAALAHVPAMRDVWRADILETLRRGKAITSKTGENLHQSIENLRNLDASRASNAVLESLLFETNPWYSQIALDQSRRKVMALFLSSLQTWRTTGKPPVSLSSVGSAAQDPISGTPFNFAKMPDGFKVWGVDAEGNNHGGTVKEAKNGNSPMDSDVLLEYPWSPAVLPEAKPKVPAHAK